MLIIKPYGSSATKFDEIDGRNKHHRVLDRRSVEAKAKKEFRIAAFCRAHPEFILSQWISIVDKIAKKPDGKAKATLQQRRFRQRIGDAVWAYLSGPVQNRIETGPDVAKRFWAKIHPYPNENHDGKAPLKGRWFYTFLGKQNADDETDLSTLPALIDHHLFVRQFQRGKSVYSRELPAPTDRDKGLVEARGLSIEKNVLSSKHGAVGTRPPWSKDDVARFERSGDIASKIRNVVKDSEQSNYGAGMRKIAPVLYEHYARLFPDDDGGALTIAEAREIDPGLFNLFEAVKKTYQNRVRGHKSHTHKSLWRSLPGNMRELTGLVGNVRANSRINALIRKGKIIHYTARPDAVTHPEAWPETAELSASKYWSSEGQHEIKRTEAYVRAWRTVLAFAGRTLEDWADPHRQHPGDFMTASFNDALKNFDTAAFDRKASLLFGSVANQLSKASEEDKKNALKGVRDALSKLRNNSFHFKDTKSFAKGVRSAANRDIGPILEGLWQRDMDARSGRARDTLIGVKADRFFSQDRLLQVFRSIRDGKPSKEILPRFGRMIARHENAWTEHALKMQARDGSTQALTFGFPDAPNRRKMEASDARRCQYTVLKLLYERAFPSWLESCSTSQLQGFISKSVARSTQASRHFGELAVAKASGKITLSEGDMIGRFFDEVSRQTASEMRIQLGYDPDQEAAKEKSKYIDDLKTDVVIMAFFFFLNTQKLRWLLSMKPDDLPASQPISEIKDGHLHKNNSDAGQSWQHMLYVIMHLVPATDVSRLLHQFKKLQALSKDAETAVLRGPGLSEASPGGEFDPSGDIDRIIDVFDLYMAMHDAKFEGGDGIDLSDDLTSFFESPQQCNRIYRKGGSKEPGSDNDSKLLPLRGLREMLRFGNLARFRDIFESEPITEAEVSELLRLERKVGNSSYVAEAQGRREELHKLLVKQKPAARNPDDLIAYREVLEIVITHRQLAARVRLTDQVRLYQLTMQTLGRLADFAGLWERDLYFAFLALLAEHDLTPRTVNGELQDGASLRDALKGGQIVEALYNLSNTAVLNDLERLFGIRFGAEPNGEDKSRKGAGLIECRNNLQHLEILTRSEKRINLTAQVTATRELMHYDRKLKNAVTKSIIDLLDRERLILKWTMKDHKLSYESLSSHAASHLGDTTIKEALHGDAYIRNVANLFRSEEQQAD